MVDFIVIAVLGIVVGTAVLYIRKEKKKGVTCIGCPHAATCGKCGGCTCSTEQKQCIYKS